MNYDPENYWKPIGPVETEKPEKLIPKAEPEPEFPALTEMESKPVGDWEVKLSLWEKIQAALKIIDLLQTIRRASVGIGVTNEGLTIQIYLNDGAVGVGVDSVSTAIGVYAVDGSVAIGVTEEGSSTQLYKADGDIIIGATLNGSTVAVINANGVVDMSVRKLI